MKAVLVIACLSLSSPATVGPRPIFPKSAVPAAFFQGGGKFVPCPCDYGVVPGSFGSQEGWYAYLNGAKLGVAPWVCVGGVRCDKATGAVLPTATQYFTGENMARDWLLWSRVGP